MQHHSLPIIDAQNKNHSLVRSHPASSRTFLIFPASSRLSSTGVSQMRGRFLIASCERMCKKPSSPIEPSPICSWRSSPEPRSPFESFRVDQLNPPQAKDLIKPVERILDSSLRTQVIPGTESMTGVKAETDPGRILDPFHDRCDILKTAPDPVFFTCRIFEQQHNRSIDFFESTVDHARNTLLPRPDPLFPVMPKMGYQVRDAEHATT